MNSIAITVRHRLSPTLKGEFFKILSFLQQYKKKIFLCPFAKKFVKNSKNFSHLPEISKKNFDKNSSLYLDFFLFFGGDGTLLRTVNTYLPKIFDIPLFGINAGNLGFFSSLSSENIASGLEQIFSTNYTKDERMLLEIEILGNITEKIKKFYALNEVVIHHNKIARLRKISTKISGEFLTNYKADGLIISTPTGSTAYNLSAGGPIVAVQMDAFIITPLAPAGFSQRPIVIPPQKTLEFSVDGAMLLSSDGQRFLKIDESHIIKISASSQKLSFIRLKDESYYKNIREKLGWGR